MLVLLMAAALATHPANAAKCEHLRPSEVFSRVEKVRNVMFLGITEPARGLGDLANYWRGTCADERSRATRGTVRALSGLLSSGVAIRTITSMLLDVGPNLVAARADVDTAIFVQTAREDDLMRASAPIMPESGVGPANLLRCVRRKMDTGELDQKLCYNAPSFPSY